MRKILFLLLLALMCACQLQAGSYHWNDGVLVRGGEFLNNAIDEKIDTADYNDRSLGAQVARVATYTTVSATTTISIPSTYSYVRISDNATDSTNVLSFAAASEGMLLYIYNNDASATSGIATISTLKMGSLMYASGSWRLLSDE